MEVKKIVEGMTAVEVAEVIDSNFKNQNKILEEDIATQNSVIGVSEYKDFSEAEAVNVGDVRKYNGLLYECVEATTGAFDASKWKKSSFKAETEKKLSELGSEMGRISSDLNLNVLGIYDTGNMNIVGGNWDYSYKYVEFLAKANTGYNISIYLTEPLNIPFYVQILDDKKGVVGASTIKQGDVVSSIDIAVNKDSKCYLSCAISDMDFTGKFVRFEVKASESIDLTVKENVKDITQIKNIQRGLVDLTDNIGKYVSFDNVDNGHYIDSNGDYQTLGEWARTYPIKLNKGDKIKLTAKGYNTNVSMIALVVDESTNKYTPLVTSVDSNINDYSYIAKSDCEVCLSYSTINLHSAVILYGNSNEDPLNGDIEEQINEVISFDDVDNGHYINILGEYQTLGEWARTYPIQLYEGDKIVFNARGYSTITSMIALVVDESAHKYTSLVASVDSEVREYEFVAKSKCQVCLSYNVKSEPSAKIYTHIRKTVQGIYKDIEFEINSKIDVSYLFQRLAVVGDSLSSGELVKSDGTLIGDVYSNSWLSYLARKINASARTHYSHGGQTTKGWILDANDGLAKMESDNQFGTYFIALGVNDSSNEAEKKEGSYPLGTINDSADEDTFVGYYKKIIESIKKKAPNAVIFCVDLYASNNTFTPYNNMIADICDLYEGVFLVDYSKSARAENLLYSPTVSEGGHFTTYGYCVVADEIIKILNRIVRDNISYFKFYGQYNSVGSKFEE